MRRTRSLGVTAALSLLAGCAGGHRQPVVVEPGAPATGAVYGEDVTSLPAGTELWVKLESPITLQNRPGDVFVSHVAETVRAPGGEVLIPEGAIVTGEVNDVRPAYGDQPMGVRLAVTGIEMEGVRQPLYGQIVRADPKGRTVRARDVAIGAGAGALLGAILERGKGALVGGALGAGVGALVSLGRSGDAGNELPRGTALAIELDQPIRTLAGLRGGRYY